MLYTKDQVSGVINDLFVVVLSPKIGLIAKINFLVNFFAKSIIYMFNKSDEKEFKFIDGKDFVFCGNHIGLLLNHLAYHIKYYVKYYKDASSIVDVGASFGTFPRISRFFNSKLKIISIEMVPLSYSYLIRNCGFLSNTKLLNYAIGRQNKTIQYYFDPKFPEGGNVQGISYSESGKVKQRTLDYVVNSNKVKHISVLKIDTEGYELNVIEGSRKTLAMTDIVIIEVENYGNNAKKVELLMKKSGFKLIDKGAINFDFKNKTIHSLDLIFKKSNVDDL